MKKKEFIHKTSAAKIFYYPEIETIEIVWDGLSLLDNNKYKEPFISVMELSHHYNIKNIISDVRNQGVVPPSEKSWFKNELIPKLKNYNLKKIAIINNNNIFKNYYLNAITKLIQNQEVNVKTFNNIQKAIQWIGKTKIYNYEKN